MKFKFGPIDVQVGLTPKPIERPMLRQGSKGEHVSYLQRTLGGDLDIDGDFGPLTRDAVKAFQRRQGLDVDGIVGPKTWAALG